MTDSNDLAKKMCQLMPQAGVMSTDVPNFSLVRSDDVMQSRKPIIYEPCIYIVIQGKKVAALGSDDYIYDGLNYLVLSVPLPLECQVLEASVEKPYLAVKVDINTAMLNELIEESTANFKNADNSPVRKGIFVSSLGDNIRATLERILSYVDQPASAKVLGGMAIKELLFHVLAGAQGDYLRAFAYRDKQSFQIAAVINFIQSHYTESLEVADLASKANMSQSSFHHYFKAVTSSSPIQYIKTIRLHAARRNMLYDNKSAGDAAYHVGYSSPSQFSREYRRLFGVSPSIDMQLSTNDV